MKSYKNDSFGERLTTAADARTAALKRFLARPGPDDPAVLERQAAQKAISEAREARNAERMAVRAAEAAQQAAEQKARDVEAAARVAADAAGAAARAAEQKAARDARYAARAVRRQQKARR
jgi:hypothetical protein